MRRLLAFVNLLDIVRLSDSRWYRRMQGGIWVRFWAYQLGENGYYAWARPEDTPPDGWCARPVKTEDYATLGPKQLRIVAACQRDYLAIV